MRYALPRPAPPALERRRRVTPPAPAGQRPKTARRVQATPLRGPRGRDVFAEVFDDCRHGGDHLRGLRRGRRHRCRVGGRGRRKARELGGGDCGEARVGVRAQPGAQGGGGRRVNADDDADDEADDDDAAGEAAGESALSRLGRLLLFTGSAESEAATPPRVIAAELPQACQRFAPRRPLDPAEFADALEASLAREASRAPSS